MDGSGCRRLFPIATLGYVFAQAVALSAWGDHGADHGMREAGPSEWRTTLTTAPEGEFRRILDFALPFVLPPAIMFGLLDGVARCTRDVTWRAVAAISLGFLTLFWVVPVGVLDLIRFGAQTYTVCWYARPYWLTGSAR